MANAVIVGMQWGDEGKGKIVDLLCPAFHIVARYQGGHNAGHTVRFGDEHFSLHLIPSGILHQGKVCVLGNGMVIHPGAFLEEVEKLEAAGIDVKGRLFVSNRAHAILPAYTELDHAREESLGLKKIGTTGRGIGPAYENKASRKGLRLCDLSHSNLDGRLRNGMVSLDAELQARGHDGLGHPAQVGDQCRDWADRLKPYLKNTEHLLNSWIEEGRSVLFEGAQGALLDIDHGTYPFVTSSNSTTGGACTGTGVPPTRIDGAIGVLKAYTTRVGGGPFLTELENETGEYLRKRGNEFGTTTGRPRRCGWLDLVAAKYARRINGVDTIALTKLDVLDTLDTIPVCLGYRYRGTVYKTYPAEFQDFSNIEPVYIEMRGWKQSTVGVVQFDQLPAAAQQYVELIEQELGVSISIVSTGPRREETSIRHDANLSRLTGDRLGSVIAERSY